MDLNVKMNKIIQIIKSIFPTGMSEYSATGVTVQSNGSLLMNGGIWKYGTWNIGTWKNGIWGNGIWEDGAWKDGIWEDGVWQNGTWEDGWILDPDRKGNFEKDWEREDNYVRSPINPKEYFAEKKEKSLTKEETISVNVIVEINGKKYKLVEIT